MARQLNWHHRWFPESDYRDPEGRKFRNWPCQLVLVVVHSHEEEHTGTHGRTRPDDEYIRKVNRIHERGVCPHPFCQDQPIYSKDHYRRQRIEERRRRGRRN